LDAALRIRGTSPLNPPLQCPSVQEQQAVAFYGYDQAHAGNAVPQNIISADNQGTLLYPIEIIVCLTDLAYFQYGYPAAIKHHLFAHFSPLVFAVF
jgi:hypothetical protein